MLPFQKKKEGSVSMPIESVERKPDSEPNYGLEACGQDLISAIKAGDAKAAGEALKAAFELCDSQPHYEGPHE